MKFETYDQAPTSIHREGFRGYASTTRTNHIGRVFVLQLVEGILRFRVQNDGNRSMHWRMWNA